MIKLIKDNPFDAFMCCMGIAILVLVGCGVLVVVKATWVALIS